MIAKSSHDFKVKNTVAQEIDTRFFIDANGNNYLDDGETVIDGAQIMWTDTLGAQNGKSSYYNAGLHVNHEAHIERRKTAPTALRFPPRPAATSASSTSAASASRKRGRRKCRSCSRRRRSR